MCISTHSEDAAIEKSQFIPMKSVPSRSRSQRTKCESATQQNHECSGSTCSSTIANRRSENSLETLCARFCKLYSNETEPLQIDVAASKLCIQRRRMYEIFNIIQSVGLIARIRTGLYQWQSNEIMIAKLVSLKRSGTETFKKWNLGESIITSGAKTINRKKAISTLMGECFLQVLLSEKFPQPIVLEDVADIVASLVGGTKHISCSRRLYDIANVFCGLGLLNRTALKLTTDRNCRKRRMFNWCGPIVLSSLSDQNPLSCSKSSCGSVTQTTSPSGESQESQSKSVSGLLINEDSSSELAIPVPPESQNNVMNLCDTREHRRSISGSDIPKSSDELKLQVNSLIKALEDAKARERKLLKRIHLLENRITESSGAELDTPSSPIVQLHKEEIIRPTTIGGKRLFSPMLSQELSPVTQQILGEGCTQDQLRQYVAFHISPLILTSLKSGTKTHLMEPQSLASNENIQTKRRKIRVGPSLVDPTETDSLKNNTDTFTRTNSRMSYSECGKHKCSYNSERTGQEQDNHRECSTQNSQSSINSSKSSATMLYPHSSVTLSPLANASSSIHDQQASRNHKLQCSSAPKSSTLAVQFSQHFLLESPSSIARTFDGLSSP